DDLKKRALSDENITGEQARLSETVKTYIDKYYPQLKQINNDTNLAKLKLVMVEDIKQILSQFANVDQYAGYQIVADLWQNSLEEDAELIAANGFYEAGRTRKPNMVEKGSGAKKRTVQDGWLGAIVPNDLIADVLYQGDKAKINELEQKATDIESELSELVEAAKIEDTPEYDVLFDVLKKNDDDEPQDSFESKKVKAALKESEKGSNEANYLKQVNNLMSAKTKTNREIKNAKADLQEAIYARIEQLTDEEIDQLMQEKWFGGFEEKMVKLVTQPLLADLQTLEMLNDRYADTLDDIDSQISQAESELNSLIQDLVVK
ncbi:type I restriction-modification system subunit M, partial [Limosilactobacillus fermentum]